MDGKDSHINNLRAFTSSKQLVGKILCTDNMSKYAKFGFNYIERLAGVRHPCLCGFQALLCQDGYIEAFRNLNVDVNAICKSEIRLYDCSRGNSQQLHGNIKPPAQIPQSMMGTAALKLIMFIPNTKRKNKYLYMNQKKWRRKWLTDEI